MHRTRPMTRDEAVSNAVSRAISVTQDGEVVSFDRDVFKADLRLAGFAVVPVEPTEKMVAAAEVASTRHAFEHGQERYPTGSEWEAMIAAYEQEQDE